MSAAEYEVTGQQQVRGYDAGRNLVDLYEIYYRNANGISGSVRVPVATASPALVDQLITQALTTQLQIANLGANG